MDLPAETLHHPAHQGQPQTPAYPAPRRLGTEAVPEDVLDRLKELLNDLAAEEVRIA